MPPTELNQVSSSTSVKKKRKLLKENGVTTTAVSEYDEKCLNHTVHKALKASFKNHKSDLKAVPSCKPQKKQFKTLNKMKNKVDRQFEENGSNTLSPGSSNDQVDVPVSKDRSEKFRGTNGSGLINKKSLKECAKDENVNTEKNILLARIERKGVCSNWKTFKEVVNKNDSSSGKASKFTTKKKTNHLHRLKVHKDSGKNVNSKKDDSLHSSTNKRENIKSNNETSLNKTIEDCKVQKSVNGGFNGSLKSVTTNFNVKKFKKHHSDSFQNRKEHITGGIRNGTHQESMSGTTMNHSKRLTKQIALDCEMVGTEDNSDMVARVSLVNKFGECVYDKYVTPTEKVLDYRTWVSGIRPENLKNAEDFKQVQKEVAELLQGRLLVGHAVRNDLKVLFLSHPRKYTRDTQRFKLFREMAKTKRPSLKKLASTILNVNIQEGEHSSVEDARVAMQLYMLYQKKWEKLYRKSKRKATPTTTAVTAE